MYYHTNHCLLSPIVLSILYLAGCGRTTSLYPLPRTTEKRCIR
ncbi:MAG: lipoprotein [Negativicutes bacterium]